MAFYPPETFSRKQSLPLVPLCGACGLYRDCESPKMRPDGEGRRRVLIVGEAPGENEDRRGKPLVGNAGMHLSSLLINLGVRMRRDCWMDNAIVCRPHDDGRNRPPTREEVSHCLPRLARVIRDLSPDVIIPAGVTATSAVVSLAWKPGEVDNITQWVGWRIPSQVLNAWVCPTYHPSHLLRNEEPAAELHTVRHLAEAFALKGKPWPQPPSYLQNVRVVRDHREGAALIRRWVKVLKPVAFDYETTTLKPDGGRAAIICVGLSDGEEAFCTPFAGEVIPALSEFLKSDTPKVAANLRFEERWTRRFLKHGVRNWLWDTVVGAHWLDCRHGVCSLKLQAFVLLGQPDYDSHLDPFIRGAVKGGNVQNRLREVDPQVLMTYCARDAMLEVLVARKQMSSREG